MLSVDWPSTPLAQIFHILFPFHLSTNKMNSAFQLTKQTSPLTKQISPPSKIFAPPSPTSPYSPKSPASSYSPTSPYSLSSPPTKPTKKRRLLPSESVDSDDSFLSSFFGDDLETSSQTTSPQLKNIFQEMEIPDIPYVSEPEIQTETPLVPTST